ncbi:CATRA system-associated protein [Streptomyces sp. NPDC088910]|uniref:CATRA system-associated protein n=1 Tax=Streptomyces sp. NPDC088910 TaxID=3365911 RepID=UPI0038017EA1
MTDRLSVRSVLGRVEAIEDWLLTSEEWGAVGAALDALSTALADGSEEGVRGALGALQRLEESRRALARPGPVKSFIPQRQREQRNILVRRLTLDLSSEDRGPAAGPSTGGGPSSTGPAA